MPSIWINKHRIGWINTYNIDDKKKDRVVIVSSYGNPLAINVWLKYYEK